MKELEEEVRTSLAVVRASLVVEWKRVLVWAFSGAVAAGVLAFLLPRVFVAQVLLLPVEQPNQTRSLRTLASSLAELYLGSTVGADLTAALPDVVRSRVYLERLLATSVRLSEGGEPRVLLDILQPRGMGEVRVARAVRKLGRRIRASIDRRTGTITLQTRLGDRFAAADAANAGATLLQDVINDLFTSRASQERSFLEERIEDTQNRLRRSEDQLKSFREQNVRMGGSPRLMLEEGRLSRAVQEQEQIYLTLRDQYELARIGEARRIPSIRVVDPAVPPLVHDWPPRGFFALGGLILGGMGGTIAAVKGRRSA